MKSLYIYTFTYFYFLFIATTKNYKNFTYYKLKTKIEKKLNNLKLCIKYITKQIRTVQDLFIYYTKIRFG